ncbi:MULTISPECIES: hypothetical protein [unclassified Bacillus (in: firmicutes)]|uniref:hypothetical protein n=1 Tax=unclassified Bacillus (in: firmicutes) TaxID=185979 RepID=UPI001BEA4D28|nr:MULTISPECIES: hypothetical protein [unclassified Bacillus (in: firmicutes)]MBT2616135.1 hypothetical protein [Bacillus sp. ISL-78]MBT2628415.1 hypothetical protein [Bacillus sp. ISL-101]
MDITGILKRVFVRTIKDDVIEIIRERKEGWTPDTQKKADLEADFLSLAGLIRPGEIEDFVEMAVMKKSQGLPAYTYKVTNLDFLGKIEKEAVEEIYTKIDDPFGTQYTITTEQVENSETSLRFVIRLKEYTNSFITGIRSTENLSAVFRATVELNKSTQVLTVFAGDQEFHEIIINYLTNTFGWPLLSYEITAKASQASQISNASYKTSVLIDFIYNRLSSRGIRALLVEDLKFKVSKSQAKRTKIKSVSINGEDILMSQLACEYVSMGSDIIFIKVSMVSDKKTFSCKIYLQGRENKILKIVVQDNSDGSFCNEIMRTIQEEYIKMCNDGIYDIHETKQRIEKIYDKFINSSSESVTELTNKLIQENALHIIESFAKVSYIFDVKDEKVVSTLKEFIKSNETLLNTVGYGDDNNHLLRFKELIGEENEEEFVEEEYISKE